MNRPSTPFKRAQLGAAPLCLTFIAVLMTGCFGDLFDFGEWETESSWDNDWNYDDDDDYARSYRAITIEEGYLDGTLGRIDFDAEVGLPTGYEDYDWTTVGGTVDAPNDQIAMAMISWEGGLESLGSEVPPGLFVVGCSGPKEGAWDYDYTTQDVDLVVEEVDVEVDGQPDVYALHFVARFPLDTLSYVNDTPAETSTVSGAFVVSVEEDEPASSAE